MRYPRQRGSTSNIVRIFIPDNSVTTGAGLTGLTNASTNLAISYIRTLDAAGTQYTGANIEAQTTIGTYQAPSTSSKIRFKAVDATNFPGLYELQFHDSATAFGSGDLSDTVAINILELTTTALKVGPNMTLISLVPWNYQDGVRMGLTGIANAAAGASGGLLISGSNSGTTTLGALTVTGATTLTGAVSLGSTLGVTGTTTLAALTSTGITANITGNLVGTVSTLTTYTGNTPQTGDSFTRIGALGAGLTALAPSATALSTAQWTNGRAALLDNLDVAVSTRLASAGYTTPPTAATIAGLTWDIVLSAHTTAGTTGAGLGSASSAGDPWATAIPGSYAAGTAGAVLGNKTGYALSSAGLDAINVEAGLNFRQAQSIIASAVAGIGGTVSSIYKGAGVATTRITFSASGGERTAIALNPPA